MSRAQAWMLAQSAFEEVARGAVTLRGSHDGATDGAADGPPVPSPSGSRQGRLRETVRPTRHLPHLNALGEETWLRP